MYNIRINNEVSQPKWLSGLGSLIGRNVMQIEGSNDRDKQVVSAWSMFMNLLVHSLSLLLLL